jgi:hypothetical protein
MNKKFKGQGALEYLLLIGGAVLIAVIVIALLVGMGGQSRDTAQEQTDKAQQAADVPQPAQIVSVDTNTTQCLTGDDIGHPLDINVSWRALGEGGSHSLFILDNSGKEIAGPFSLNPTQNQKNLTCAQLTQLKRELWGLLGAKKYDCGDSFYIQIETTKNNQTVKSARFRFGWW